MRILTTSALVSLALTLFGASLFSVENTSNKENTDQREMELEYVVQSGDTLRGIADRFLGSWEEWEAIAGANNITNPRELRAGESLFIPNLITDEGYSQVGTASWYGEYFHGNETASGEIYNMYAYTAAHKTLPLGTLVKVTSLENRQYVVVTINDRGPFVDGRIIDLSYKAAEVIGMSEDGTTRVKVQVISFPTERIS